MQEPETEKKEAPSPIRSKRGDSRFLNFVGSWVARYNQDRHARVAAGHDFIIDFDRLALHPATQRGAEFIDYFRNKFK